MGLVGVYRPRHPERTTFYQLLDRFLGRLRAGNGALGRHLRGDRVGNRVTMQEEADQPAAFAQRADCGMVEPDQDRVRMRYETLTCPSTPRSTFQHMRTWVCAEVSAAPSLPQRQHSVSALKTWAP